MRKNSSRSGKNSPSPMKIWSALFGLWLIFLTGIFHSLVGSPGAIQAFRLQSLLSSKQDKIAELENDLARLEMEKSRLEKSTLTQQREIRRVLGYAAKDEIIYHFTN